ncbi:MAG: hypothetical protein US42_C0011G0046 [Candidatus Magasanikbacteria bacterium GW2011_GWC2_37_14]|uniref:Uncharacterized protein n=1 Tax=Candidatus Magasanikbacteria bacterium GW2011_GWC2_37_14 TaxID=1619046 RepID=A0A0G0G876_9BACT|nr:MAG: hypothetical protein US42_C0011G0046 [Candidatus Magasanikbacteria bacterium GW2011_GWC2_37_14]
MWILVLQRLTLEFFLDFLYFPIWWFTSGILHSTKFCWNLFLDGNILLAPGLWLKNLFVPMFGQSDFQGRLVSVMMRFFNVIFRSIALFIWLLVVFVIFLLWINIPIFLVFMFYQALN